MPSMITDTEDDDFDIQSVSSISTHKSNITTINVITTQTDDSTDDEMPTLSYDTSSDEESEINQDFVGFDYTIQKTDTKTDTSINYQKPTIASKITVSKNKRRKQFYTNETAQQLANAIDTQLSYNHYLDTFGLNNYVCYIESESDTESDEDNYKKTKTDEKDQSPKSNENGTGNANENDDDDKKEQESDHINQCLQTHEILTFEDNNLLFDYQRVALGKTYISGASAYPPELDENCAVGAFNTHTNTCTNCIIDGNDVIDIYQLQSTVDIQDINQENYDNYSILLSDTAIEKCNELCFVKGLSDYEFTEDTVEHIINAKGTILIENKRDKWHVRVPIRLADGTIVRIRIFADPGANAGCVRTDWAIKHFRPFIRRNTKTSILNTPGGKVHPKYVLWLTFPSKSGKILKARMYLVDELPVPILADINMLRAFGYSFKDETPPFFSKPAEPDLDLELAEDGYEQLNVNTPISNWFERYQKSKRSHYTAQPIDEVPIVNQIYSDDRILYDSRCGALNPNTNITYQSLLPNDINQNELFITDDGTLTTANDIVDTTDLCLYRLERDSLYTPLQIQKHCKQKTIIANVTYKTVPKLINKINEINAINKHLPIPQIGIDSFGNDNTKSPIYRHCLLINANNRFLATEYEKAQAAKLLKNEKLVFNNLDYLKEYEKKYGKRFKMLYESITYLIKKYQCVFATHEFSRKTMNVPPMRLGIKPEHRDKIMYAPQYPINPIQRLHMINYTKLNHSNGFWRPIWTSIHCVPYTMVPKKRHGVIYRYRPAFDGRVVNQYCELMDSHMPTQQDFDNLFSIYGFTTMADVKNFFGLSIILNFLQYSNKRVR